LDLLAVGLAEGILVGRLVGGRLVGAAIGTFTRVASSNDLQISAEASIFVRSCRSSRLGAAVGTEKDRACCELRAASMREPVLSIPKTESIAKLRLVVGTAVGALDGATVGCRVGGPVANVGNPVGVVVGITVGLSVGLVGIKLGMLVGTSVGRAVGNRVGSAVSIVFDKWTALSSSQSSRPS
jgi:hypothetical protein